MRQVGLGARGGAGTARLCIWPFATTFAEAAVTVSEMGEEVVAGIS